MSDHEILPESHAAKVGANDHDSTADDGVVDDIVEKSNLLSSSENANNENREIELLQNTSGGGGDGSEMSTSRDAVSSDNVTPANSENVTYNENGDAVYTDPSSKATYKWDKVKMEWILDEIPENEHYRWCKETSQWIPKARTSDGATTAVRYENGQHMYTDTDGMVFFWDTEKNAWFPKIDDDFMARYQMSYGFSDSTQTATETPQMPGQAEVTKGETEASREPADGQLKMKRKAEPPKWFDLAPEHNTKVYVSNLPLDITEEEFVELMSKCGMIMRDVNTQKLKIKLYLEPDGSMKGDGLCDYIKIESVDLALNILDGSMVRGKKISVQRAKFQMRGEYNPNLKPKKKKKDKDREKKMKEKLFDWRPDKMRGERARHERVVIVKNLFDPEIFIKDVHLLLEYQKDLREECSKCGTVRKVIIYDCHPEGVAQVSMADPDEADLVVKLLDQRMFAQRKLGATLWDGKTRYKVEESTDDANRRREQWDQHLDDAEVEKQTVQQQPQPQQ